MAMGLGRSRETTCDLLGDPTLGCDWLGDAALVSDWWASFVGEARPAVIGLESPGELKKKTYEISNFMQESDVIGRVRFEVYVIHQ